MRNWVTTIKTTHYLVGSAKGPHPFPTIVCDFQSVIVSEIQVTLVSQNLHSKVTALFVSILGCSQQW